MQAVALEALHTELVRHFDSSPQVGAGEPAPQPDFVKLEALGYKVGKKLVARLTKERGPFPQELDIIKFLCRDIWATLFQKHVDKLQTNHRGVYVLQDRSFKWLTSLSLSPSEGEAELEALKYLVFPSGIIRGVLSICGFDCTVRADINVLPEVKFAVRIL